jgi:DNA-binding SARP family transcriptional activator
VTTVRIDLLGGFRLSVDGHAVDDSAWSRRKPAGVIKLLALAGGHRMHREQLADTLWPDLDRAAAGANLRKAVHQARRAVAEVTESEVIASDADSIWLDAAVVVDLEDFHSAVAQARRSGDISDYDRAVAGYRGDLLPDDRYDDWATTSADSARREFLATLEELAGLLESRGDIETAIEVVRRLVDAEPLGEDNHVTLIRLNALAGRRAEALRAYEHLDHVLDTELGTEPGPMAQQLVEEIRSHNSLEPDLTADLWERVGDLRMLSGDAEGATQAFAAVLESDNSHDTEARVQRKCADAWLMRHRPDQAGSHVAAAAVLTDDGPELARLLRSQANLAWETGDIAAAEKYAELAHEEAVATGTADDVAAAQEALAIVSHFKGEWRDGLASALDRLAVDEGSTSQLSRVFDLHHCIGQYHLYGDGLSESVEDYARRILDRAEDVGAVRAQAFAWCLLGESLLLQARWDESEGCLERSCDLHASLGSRSGALPWQRRAELAVCHGRPDEAEDYLRRATAIATVSPMASHMWGRIYATRAFAAVEAGAPNQAVEAVRNAAASAQRYGDCPSCSALLNPIAAEAFAMLADVESARPFAAAAERVGQMFASSAWQAMAQSAGASVAAADGDHSGAKSRFDAASDLYERARQPYWSERASRGNAEGTQRS